MVFHEYMREMGKYPCNLCHDEPVSNKKGVCLSCAENSEYPICCVCGEKMQSYHENSVHKNAPVCRFIKA